MNFNCYRLALTLGLAVLLLPIAGCTKKPSKPSQVYTTADVGGKDSDELIERFRKAHASRDVDAAMRLFYWHTGESPDRQEFWWHMLNEIFATPAEKNETVAPSSKSDTKTDFPSGGRFIVTTKKKQYDLLIGKNEQGFYFLPPVWPANK